MALEPTMDADRLEEVKAEITEKACEDSDNEFLACQFICMSDNVRYGGMKKALENQFLFGSDDYPKNVTQSLALIKNYKGGGTGNNNNNSKKSNSNQHEEAGLAFVGSGRDITNDQCFICGEKGHHGKTCKSVTVEQRKKHLDNYYANQKKEWAEKKLKNEKNNCNI